MSTKRIIFAFLIAGFVLLVNLFIRKYFDTGSKSDIFIWYIGVVLAAWLAGYGADYFLKKQGK